MENGVSGFFYLIEIRTVNKSILSEGLRGIAVIRLGSFPGLGWKNVINHVINLFYVSEIFAAQRLLSAY